MKNYKQKNVWLYRIVGSSLSLTLVASIGGATALLWRANRHRIFL
jgi:hypothetical protein